MLDELIEERDKGRVSGPFHAPKWWKTQTQGLPDTPLEQLPTEEISVAFCFSVTQSDKTRRCEDLRRSGHNSTVKVKDIPHHDNLDIFLQTARQYALQSHTTMAWTQDLAGAYRQFLFATLTTATWPLPRQSGCTSSGTTP